MRSRKNRHPEAVPARFWQRPAVRAVAYQLLVLLVIGVAVGWLVHNTYANMAARGIQSGWDFLSASSGFDIGESLFTFDSSQPYWQAYLVGFSNTLRVALPALVLTTLLGTLIGMGGFSRNTLLRWLCATYVECFRNIPLLLQLTLWYLLLTETLPDPQQPLNWGPLFLSKAGLSFPIWHTPSAWHGLWSDANWGTLELPRRGEFAVEGGASVSPEYLALLTGLTLYTAAFVAELVRGSLASVNKGQREAALALGLSPRQALRKVELPQALTVVIPPLTNQYQNLIKNSSLAVAIGYPDVVSITNTAINQTGRALECMVVAVLLYFSLSLLIALGMRYFNRRYTLRER